MRVLFSTYESHGNVEPLAGFALQPAALGVGVGPDAAQVMPTGVWR